MTSRESVPVPFVLSEHALAEHEAEAILAGAVVAEADVAVVELRGPGVMACLQGILTNDVEGAGDGGFLYGAVLTPKGMIICDLWTARHDGRAWLTVPERGRQALFDVFKRYLPPRLAKAVDRSDELTVLRLAGPLAVQVARQAGVAIPDFGISAQALVGDAACIVSRPSQIADFGLQIQIDRRRLPAMLESLGRAGAVVSGTGALELARILAGWPRLHAEIDDKTLPQEVRFDDICGVSYTKGCYTGQETVARVHFRGRVNKELTGLMWDATPDPTNPVILQDDRPMGRVTSLAWLAPFEQHIGLGIVKRQADLDRSLSAAHAPAGHARLPFKLDL